MSGHSHWHSIKYRKGLADVKKGKAFSKIARVITVAAREGRGNPDTNSKLRLAIEAAKKINMPSDNIERAIKRGTGELEGAVLESFAFEAYGPGGIALIIEGITDNKNRALGEVKQILDQHGSKLADTGSVQWLFTRQGAIALNLKEQPENLQNKEILELEAIESGAEDLRWRGEVLGVYTKVEDLEKVKKDLETHGLKIESTSLDWVAKEEIELPKEEKERAEKLFEALDESETVQEIYSNLKL